MLGTSGDTYAAGMESNGLTFAKTAASRRSVARTCGSFTLRCLKAIAGTYVQSSAYNPYWIDAVPLTESHRSEARQG